MRQGNIEGRGLAISRAIDIVDSGLKTSIDREAGGELAANLLTVYDLVIRNLMLANLNNDAARLDLAERLLTDIGDAWRTSTGTGSSTAIGT
jgi:flagellar protein FliS